MINMDMDNLDRKILYELDVNARQSLKSIAKKHHTSKEVVNYRIRQMERRGVIKGYYTLFDFSKLGYMSIRVYLRLKNASIEREAEITDFLRNDPRTFWVARTEGSWDMAMGYLVKTFDEFALSWNGFEKLYKSNVLEKNFSVLYEFVHYRKSYLGEGERIKNVTGISGAEMLDDTDYRLMEMISSNSRMHLIDMARALSMTPANARHRMRKLEKAGVILGYRVEPDLSKLGVRHYKIDIELESMGKIKELQTFISGHRNVTYEDRTIGGSNVEFDVEADHGKFLGVMEDVRRILGEDLRYMKYYVSKDIVKILYFPKGLTIS
jgi:Lrp/AsnC family leucine-responsive transcriptional regulator